MKKSNKNMKNMKNVKTVKNYNKYETVATNITYTGFSYRVRKSINNERFDECFPSLNKAKIFLKSL